MLRRRKFGYKMTISKHEKKCYQMFVFTSKSHKTEEIREGSKRKATAVVRNDNAWLWDGKNSNRRKHYLVEKEIRIAQINPDTKEHKRVAGIKKN